MCLVHYQITFKSTSLKERLRVIKEIDDMSAIGFRHQMLSPKQKLVILLYIVLLIENSQNLNLNTVLINGLNKIIVVLFLKRVQAKSLQSTDMILNNRSQNKCICFIQF